MARTRSQPISPGGYQSLPDKPKRRRANRSTSTEVEEKVTKKNVAVKPVAPKKKVAQNNVAVKSAVTTSTTSSNTTTKTRPRTRSQPLSPGGLQVLVEKPRQRRSNSRSQSVEQPEMQLPVAKKAPVKKGAGRKKAPAKKRAAPKAKTSNKPSDAPLSEVKNTNARTSEVLRPVSSTPISRRNFNSRRRRSVDSRTLFNLEEVIQQSSPIVRAPSMAHHLVTYEDNAIAPPRTPERPVDQTPRPTQTNNQDPPAAWTPFRSIYNSVTRRWSTIRDRIGRRGSNGTRPTSPEGIVTQPHSPEPAPIVDSEPFPPVTEDMARGSPFSPSLPTAPSVYLDRRTIRANSRANNPLPKYDYSIRGSGFSEELLRNIFGGTPPSSVRRKLEANYQSPVTHANQETATPKESEEKTASPEAPQKRKRSRSPDTIPNPPGCSYGMADGYFDYDSDDEKAAQEEQARRDAAADGPPATKKQRVDDNAQGARRRHVLYPSTPSRAESRVGYDPFRPTRLYEPTNLPTIESSGFLSEGVLGPELTQTRPNINTAPAPHPTLTFETPYGDSSDLSSEGGVAAPVSVGPVGRAGPTLTFETPYGDSSSDMEESQFSPMDCDSSPLVAVNCDSSMSRPAGTDSSPVSRARDRAEQYKPKTPSRLRQIDQTSPYTTTPTTNTANTPSTPGTRQRALQECTSVDTSKLEWPEPKPIDRIFPADAMSIFSADTMSLVQSKWTANSDGAVEYWEQQIETLSSKPFPGDNGMRPLTFDWPEPTSVQTSFSAEAIDPVNSNLTESTESLDYWTKQMGNQ